jgi:hypothetical protein
MLSFRQTLQDPPPPQTRAHEWDISLRCIMSCTSTPLHYCLVTPRRYLSTHPSHADRITHLQHTVQLKRMEMLQRCTRRHIFVRWVCVFELSNEAESTRVVIERMTRTQVQRRPQQGDVCHAQNTNE